MPPFEAGSSASSLAAKVLQLSTRWCWRILEAYHAIMALDESWINKMDQQIVVAHFA